MPTFNLVDSPWIPARDLDGERLTLSLRDIILQADRLRQIEDSSPLTVIALHRLLLAVLHRALEGPAVSRDAAAWWTGGFPVDRVTAYLDHYHDRFDLFDGAQPFFQVSGLGEVTNPKPWTILLAEAGSNNTTILFNPSEREGYSPSPATPAEAARALVTYQTFVLGGLIRVFVTAATAAPIANAAVLLVVGRTLHETFCLNLVPYGRHRRDVPIWERNGVLTVQHMRSGPEEVAAGHVQAYTWPSRSVLLLSEERDGQIVVMNAMIGGGVKLTESEAYRTDPMVAYRYDDKRGLSAIRLSPDRAVWRDFDALLPRSTTGRETAPGVVSHAHDLYRALDQRGRPPQLFVGGLVSNQAKIEGWRAEAFDLPVGLVSDRNAYEIIRNALNDAEEARKRLYGASARLAEGLVSRGGRQPSPQDKQNVVQSLPGLTQYWSVLGREFHGLLSRLTLEVDPDGLSSWWCGAIYRALNEAWRLTIRAAGADAAALRAIAQGEQVLGPYMAGLYHKQQATTGVV